MWCPIAPALILSASPVFCDLSRGVFEYFITVSSCATTEKIEKNRLLVWILKSP
jgi:hypothetical protein